LIAESFKDLGTSLDKEGIKLVKCEPNYRIVFPDKESVEMSTDLSRMKAEVERWEGKDGFEGYVHHCIVVVESATDLYPDPASINSDSSVS